MNEQPRELTTGRVKTDQQVSGMAEPVGRWAAAGKASCRAYVAPAPSCSPRQVLNQTSRMEIQMQETSLSTNKLEKQLFLQGLELHRLQDYNRWALPPGQGWAGARARVGSWMWASAWDRGWDRARGLDWNWSEASFGG